MKIRKLRPHDDYSALVSESTGQHLGRSDGGGGNFWFGRLPSWTIHAILNPQLKCTSKWQCINQTPIHHHPLTINSTLFSYINK